MPSPERAFGCCLLAAGTSWAARRAAAWGLRVWRIAAGRADVELRPVYARVVGDGSAGSPGAVGSRTEGHRVSGETWATGVPVLHEDR